MLHPVGNLPASIYWRRRLVLIVLPVFLVIVLLWAVFGGGGNHRTTSTAGTRTASVSSTRPTTSSASGTQSSTSAPPTTTATPVISNRTPSTASTHIDTCEKSDLRVEAATSSSKFQQQSRPTLFLQVTNTSRTPCRHDLADKQVQLRIQSGDARIWGSHDCQIQPGKDVVTLLPGSAVRRGIVWSGRTSAPGCKGTRLYAQPGTYELYAQLSGKQSKPVTFSLTASG